MNLFAAAGALTSVANPTIPAVVRISNGQTVDSSFKQIPAFLDIALSIEVQAVSTSDLQQVENISQQSDMRAVYLPYGIKGLNRPLQVGGDVLVFWGSEWLVTQGIEEWGNGEWAKVLVTRQISPATASL